MKKILIVTDDKEMGGVSVLLDDILKNISSQYKIDLMILNNKGNCFENLPKNINIIYGSKFFNIIGIHLKHMIKNRDFVRVIKKIYLIFLMKTGLVKNKIFKERKKMDVNGYDVEITFKDSFASTFTAYGDSKTKIQWIHSDYSKVDYLKNYKKQYIKMFNLFDKFVAVSEPVKINFANVYGQKNKIIVINNYFDVNKIMSLSNEKTKKLSDSKINIVTVGRLHKDKNIDGLIETVYKLKKDGLFNDKHLTIIGDGEEKKYLLDLCKQYELENDVTFLGNQKNPFKYVKKADLFVLASKHESFGNVVIESLVLNVPVLSTKVASISQMLPSKYGMIVENNNDALYEGMKYLFENIELIKEYKNNLQSSYKYDNEAIITKIEKLLK